jgi:hypothetical protein
VMMIVVYLIPHSVLGSELDYESGKMRNKYSFVRGLTGGQAHPAASGNFSL